MGSHFFTLNSKQIIIVISDIIIASLDDISIVWWFIIFNNFTGYRHGIVILILVWHLSIYIRLACRFLSLDHTGSPLQNHNFENIFFVLSRQYKKIVLRPKNKPSANFSWTWVLKWLRLRWTTERGWILTLDHMGIPS